VLWSGVWGEWGHVLRPALLGLVAALAVIRLLVRLRTQGGIPRQRAWRHSVAEVGMIAGTVPWVWMILTPRPGDRVLSLVGRPEVHEELLHVVERLRTPGRGQSYDLRGESPGPGGRVGPGEGDRAAVQARHAEPGCDGERPDRQRPAVQRVDLPGAGAAQHAVVQHRPGTGEVLLRRLEHERDGPAEPRPQSGQHLGDADPDVRYVLPAWRGVSGLPRGLPHRRTVGCPDTSGIAPEARRLRWADEAHTRHEPYQ
jgi:hypothetical protein